jgi:hypothetical protein
MIRFDQLALGTDGPLKYLEPLSPRTFETVRFAPSLLTAFQIATAGSDPDCARAIELPTSVVITTAQVPGRHHRCS